jgi:hypothetical protein
MNINVRSKAQLVILSVSSARFQKVDSPVSEAVCKSQQASKKAGKFVKQMIDPIALRPRDKTVTALREYLTSITLPWDRGRRLMPNQSFLKYRATIKKHIQLVDNQTDDFLKKYPSWIEHAKNEMGNLFDRAHYPSVNDLRHRFRVDLEFEPIPQKSHFLLDMQQDMVEEVSAKAEKKAEERLALAGRAAWENLLEVTRHYATVMADPKRRFKKSTVDNLLETLNRTPDLNFSEDPQLDMMVEDIRNKLSGVPVEELRESPIVRKQAAQDASDSSDTLESLMAELDSDPVLAEAITNNQ